MCIIALAATTAGGEKADVTGIPCVVSGRLASEASERIFRITRVVAVSLLTAPV